MRDLLAATHLRLGLRELDRRLDQKDVMDRRRGKGGIRVAAQARFVDPTALPKVTLTSEG